MKDRLSIYKESMESLPLHRFLGLKVEELGEGDSRVSIPINSNTLNVAGKLHGGVTYTVSDVAAFLALSSLLEPGEFAVTIDYQCSIYRGTGSGPVTFHARVARRAHRLAFMNVEVLGPGGELLAEARVTKAITRRQAPEIYR
ncbi:PaaI family thioesterase [Desulfallas thermosapovorans]|uniref:Uncharacterized protein (TIGR00369 family) n=1 Tax=Desulfallas thermosapovorans DSM 6562 TaxID=1121431 RepID=A0A5S4ZQX8_9FIRM|nr:PaaI family thioesterase [Desulfallas thermosapovorans]TYO95110.1 uncharacterized protein (TIGR00369 family) [Desulfallas thermosapovorans DSM 6562]